MDKQHLANYRKHLGVYLKNMRHNKFDYGKKDKFVEESKLSLQTIWVIESGHIGYTIDSLIKYTSTLGIDLKSLIINQTHGIK